MSSPPASHDESAAASLSLPRPQANEGRIERALFATLALSAAFCLAQALAPIFQASPAWLMVQAGLTQLAG